MPGLDTPEPDPKWLETREGIDWLLSVEGQAWSKSEASRRFINEAPESFFHALGQHGFEEYFAGRMPKPPPGWFTPDTAPKIGTRVRFTNTHATLGGQRFHDGELAFVSELHLTAVGSVRVTVRTLDGRRQIMLIDDGSIQPA